MKKVLVCNQKGGVGKSLIADELAFSLERTNTPYSFYDLDNQGGTVHKTFDNPAADIQVIDTPGALQKDLREWMSEADVIVIPTRASSRDIVPLQRMMQIAEECAADKPVVYVLNAWNRYRVGQDFMDWFQSVYKEMQLLVVPQSEQFAQASLRGISAVEQAPKNSAVKSMVVVTNKIRLLLGLRQEHIDSAEFAAYYKALRGEKNG